MTTIGTHNLLDGEGGATPFADLIFFTEAVPPIVREEIGDTHDVYVCERQKDLVIAIAKSLGINDFVEHYKKAHWGVRKVTPNRGTYWLTSEKRELAPLVEHRINAAFAPFKRGEGLFRKTMWEIHTRMTLRIVRRLKRQGFTIYAGGDLNTPRDISGYRGVLVEAGPGLDRLGSTRDLAGVEVLSRMGSDHHRVRARVE